MADFRVALTDAATLLRHWSRVLLRRKPSRTAFHIASIEALVDERYYFRCYPEARQAAQSAAEHYVHEGWRRGFNPAPWFSSEGYLLVNADVAGTGISPLAHYAIFGRREGRTIVPTGDVYQPKAERTLPLAPISLDLRALRRREENNWDAHIAQYTERRLAQLEP
ncbi:MAG: hypothetical protein AAGF49_03725 [Pseudomonadota bacterium]